MTQAYTNSRTVFNNLWTRPSLGGHIFEHKHLLFKAHILLDKGLVSNSGSYTSSSVTRRWESNFFFKY